MPILFYLPGDIPVYASPILIGLGGTIGLAWIAWRTPAEVRIRYLNTGLLALLGALLSGRILFVLLNWSYFQLHAAEIPLFFLGGFSWVGAYLGGFTSLVLIASLSNHKLGPLSDAVLPLLGTLTVSAWLACWLDGCAYGRPTAAWWGLMAKDEWGLVFHAHAHSTAGRPWGQQSGLGSWSPARSGWNPPVQPPAWVSLVTP